MLNWDDEFFEREVRDPETIRILKVVLSNSMGRLSDRGACRVLKMDIDAFVAMRTRLLQATVDACAEWPPADRNRADAGEAAENA